MNLYHDKTNISIDGDNHSEEILKIDNGKVYHKVKVNGKTVHEKSNSLVAWIFEHFNTFLVLLFTVWLSVILATLSVFGYFIYYLATK